MREYGIEEFEMEYMESDYETLTNYKLFCDDIRGEFSLDLMRHVSSILREVSIGCHYEGVTHLDSLGVF